jgi:hypothetical protein
LSQGQTLREEAVQGAGILAPFHAQGAAESGASVRLGVRSYVPGKKRDRAQADEAGIRKAEPQIRLFPKESAHGPSAKGVRPMNRLRRTSQVHATWLGCWTGGGYVRSVYAPEPPSGFTIYDVRFMIWIERLRRDVLVRVHRRSSAVEERFAVDSSQFPVCPQPSVLCRPPSRPLRPGVSAALRVPCG